jgi:hypothetical protein
MTIIATLASIGAAVAGTVGIGTGVAAGAAGATAASLGVGTAATIGAASTAALGAGVGATSAAIQGQDVGKGALMGAGTGLATAGVAGGLGAAAGALGAPAGAATNIGVGAATGATVGAGKAAIEGGDIGKGALMGAGTGAAGAVAGNVVSGMSDAGNQAIADASKSVGNGVTTTPLAEQAPLSTLDEIGTDVAGGAGNTVGPITPVATGNPVVGGINSALGTNLTGNEMLTGGAMIGGAGYAGIGALADSAAAKKAEEEDKARGAKFRAQNSSGPLAGLGDIGMATGGITALAHGGQVPLKEGAYIIPADVVSALGNGSTKAGAEFLRHLMIQVRKEAVKRQGLGAAKNHVA